MRLERIPLDEVKTSATACGSAPAAVASSANSSVRPTMHAYSWHGKKIRVSRGPSARAAAVTNSKPTSVDKGRINDTLREGKYSVADDETAAGGIMSNNASSDAEKENASKAISKAWRESKMVRTRQMLGINHSAGADAASEAADIGESIASMPPLLPSAEPTILEDHRNGNKERKKKKNKKKSISFSMEANETRTFERVGEGDVSSVWYSKEEEMANRRAAREDDTPFERIGLADAGTQTANISEFSAPGEYGASYGHEYRIRRAKWEEKSRSKGGRRTTTAVGWRRGAKYNKVIMEDMLSFSSDFIPEALKKEKMKHQQRKGRG